MAGICKDVKALGGDSTASHIFEALIIAVGIAVPILFIRRIRKDNEFFRNLNAADCRISRPLIYGIHIDGDSENHVKTVVFENGLGCTDLLYDSRYDKKNKTYYFDDYRVVAYKQDGKYRSHCILLYNDEN